MRGIDLNAAARIDEAIEATGATVTDFEVQPKDAETIPDAMDELMGGKASQFVFTVDPDSLGVDDPERADAPLARSDDIVDFLVDFVEATESFGPVEPEMSPADHVRAALGRMDTVHNPNQLWAVVQDRRGGDIDA